MKNDQLNQFAEATELELFDDGEWLVSAEETRETVGDWIESSKSWSECLAKKIVNVGGCEAVVFFRAQLSQGDRRADISVVDMGGHRVVLHDTDVSVFC